MSAPDRFWMVYGAGQGAPTARHKTFTSAKQEAHRLARLVPGVRFFILETVGAVEKIDVQFTPLRPDYEPDVYDADKDIPF